MADTTYRGAGGDRMAGARVAGPGDGQSIIPKVMSVDADGNYVAPGTGGGTGGGTTVTTLGTGTNRSGTITAGGTAQQLLAANTARRSFQLQNTSTGDLWIKDAGSTGTDAAAASPSYRVAAGGTFNGSTNGVHSIFGATTGQSWTATEVQ